MIKKFVKYCNKKILKIVLNDILVSSHFISLSSIIQLL